MSYNPLGKLREVSNPTREAAGSLEPHLGSYGKSRAVPGKLREVSRTAREAAGSLPPHLGTSGESPTSNPKLRHDSAQTRLRERGGGFLQEHLGACRGTGLQYCVHMQVGKQKQCYLTENHRMMIE